jgi:3-deoxy-D-manno-octulosonate 8-phosphate phosphatase KdsC-like HAD superfamily phosphatase
LGIELHEAVPEITQFYSKMKAEFPLSDHEIAFICRDYSDLPIMKNVSFTAVTPDAPLEVKSESYYAAYGTGSYAVREIASLIIKSKRYPNGWSE